MWPRVCPVCLGELPERGNRRVYVPWKNGFRLVHAGACFDAIDAQGVLAVTAVNEKPRLLDPLVLVRARACVQTLLERGQVFEHSPENLLALASERVARFQEQLVRDESPEQLERRYQRAGQLVRRVLAHGREVCGPDRMEVPF